MKTRAKRLLCLCLALLLVLGLTACGGSGTTGGKKAELLSLPLWEGDKIFLHLLDTDAPFFSLKLQYEGEKLVLAVLDGKRIV